MIIIILYNYQKIFYLLPFLSKELFSYGIGNVVSCFFDGFPACVGLSRCAILDSVGGKTQAIYNFLKIF
jgi:hypothetical protein